jgi:hypothetical protein
VDTNISSPRTPERTLKKGPSALYQSLCFCLTHQVSSALCNGNSSKAIKQQKKRSESSIRSNSFKDFKGTQGRRRGYPRGIVQTCPLSCGSPGTKNFGEKS